MLRPGGRLVVIGYYGRDDVARLLEPEVVAARAWMRPSAARAGGCGTASRSRSSTPASTLSDPAAAMELLPRLYGDRGRAFLMAPHRPVPAPQPGPLPPATEPQPESAAASRGRPCKTACGRDSVRISSRRSKARLFSPRSLAFGLTSESVRGRGTDRPCDNGRPAPSRSAGRGDRRTDGHHTPRMKITYATLSADNEELQSSFDAAVERARGDLGRSYPMLIGAEERTGDETFEDRSPIDRRHRRLALPGRHPPGRARRDRRGARRLPGLARHPVARAARRSCGAPPT